MKSKSFFPAANPEKPEHPVSSLVSKVEYDEDKRKLFVTFHNGRSYEYFDVPLGIWILANEAESIAKFLHKSVFSRFESQEITKR